MEVVVDGIIYEKQSHGGISRLFNEILPRMCSMDDSLQITLLTTGQYKQALPTHAGIQHRPLFPISTVLRPSRLWWPFVPQMRALVEWLAMGSGRGKIWHSTYYTMLERWVGYVVVTVHDMIYERFADFFNRPIDEQVRDLKRRCVLTADSVICVSETAQKDLLHFYDIDVTKTRIIPLAHSERFKRLGNVDYSPKAATVKPFLLYVGDHQSHHKNFGVLLRAYCNWPRRKEADLVVVGKPSPKKEDSLQQLGIRDQIHFLTNISAQRLNLLYNQASAFVYPSLYEGFGIPLLEAMACGCPIIASRIPSTVEVAGDCPIYFEPMQVEDLLAAFETVFSEGRDSERVRIGLERAKLFSWDKTAHQTLEVYRALSHTQ